MTSQLTKKLAVFALASMAIAPVAAGLSIVTADAAYASPGNGNGNGGGSKGGSKGERGGGNGGSRESASAEGSNDRNSNGHGSVARELKGLNAMNASASAMASASPNSQVGRTAAYRDAAVATSKLSDAWEDARDAYYAHEGTYDGPTSVEIQAELDAASQLNAAIDSQIAVLDPASLTYADDLAALEAQKVNEAALTLELATVKEYEATLAELALASNELADDYYAAEGLEADALLTASGGRTLSEAALAELRNALGL